MATSKKAGTTQTAAAVTPAPVKSTATKKAAAKKSVAPVTPEVTTAKALVPVKAAAKPAQKASNKTSAAKLKTTASTRPALSDEQRNHYVEVAAFYIAERRGFAPGNPAEDWAAAEVEIDRLIASGQFAR